MGFGIVLLAGELLLPELATGAVFGAPPDAGIFEVITFCSGAPLF